LVLPTSKFIRATAGFSKISQRADIAFLSTVRSAWRPAGRGSVSSDSITNEIHSIDTIGT
jgi:hypothetical protein